MEQAVRKSLRGVGLRSVDDECLSTCVAYTAEFSLGALELAAKYDAFCMNTCVLTRGCPPLYHVRFHAGSSVVAQQNPGQHSLVHVGFDVLLYFNYRCYFVIIVLLIVVLPNL